MRKIYFLLLTLCIGTASFGQDLILTGVFDGPLARGTPKLIAFYVVADIPDLSIYGVESANNGKPAKGAEFIFPAEARAAGSYIYLGYVGSNADSFYSYFGVAPDFLTNMANNNGDDAIILYENGTAIDTFGAVGTDGTGEAWEYLDGWAHRVDGTGPDGANFIIENWTFSGINATDGCSTNSSCASVFPIGTYTLSTRNFDTNDFKLYPNPTATGFIKIKSTNSGSIAVEVFDILGKRVLKQASLRNDTLDVSMLNTGVYILKITQDNATVTKKLVID